MIIEGLMTVIYNVCSVLFAPLSLPPLPEEIVDVFASFLEYLVAGIGLLSNFVDVGYLFLLLELVLLVELGLFTYKLVMFVIRKIPMLGVH